MDKSILSWYYEGYKESRRIGDLVHPLHDDFPLTTLGGSIIFLMTSIYQMLNQGGKFICTNLAQGNPYRPWIEYVGDWLLIERCEEDFLNICHYIGVAREAINIKREETGLTLIIEVMK